MLVLFSLLLYLKVLLPLFIIYGFDGESALVYLNIILPHNLFFESCVHIFVGFNLEIQSVQSVHFSSAQ